jgi:hypothetical protein
MVLAGPLGGCILQCHKMHFNHKSLITSTIIDTHLVLGCLGSRGRRNRCAWCNNSVFCEELESVMLVAVEFDIHQ